MWRKFASFVAIILGFFLVMDFDGEGDWLIGLIGRERLFGHEAVVNKSQVLINTSHPVTTVLLSLPFLFAGIALVANALDVMRYSRRDVVPTMTGLVLTYAMLIESFTTMASNDRRAYYGISLEAFVCGLLALICFSITFARAPGVQWRMLAFLLSLLAVMGILNSLPVLGHMLGFAKT